MPFVRGSAAEDRPGLVALARAWQRRLDLQDWPVVIRVADLRCEQPRIVTGGVIDLVVLAPDAAVDDVVEMMLRYSFHNVPGGELPTDDAIRSAASELAGLIWPEEAMT